jgi:peptide/nickel transport system substrate-binding protein
MPSARPDPPTEVAGSAQSENRGECNPAGAYDRNVTVGPRGFALGVAPAVAALTLGAAANGDPASLASMRSGGTLRIASPVGPRVLDPALGRALQTRLLAGTCATLMMPGKPLRLEAAAGPPTVSRDRRTYVFTVRRGLRFSDGSAVTAENFAAGLRRILNPAMRSEVAPVYADLERITAVGRQLRIELARPSGDLPLRLALPWACPVPVGFPVDAAGVDLKVGSGPYYVALHRPGEFTLERNRNYRGPRPARIDRLVFTVSGELEDNIRAVEDGRADVLGVEIPSDVRVTLARRYGVNRRQLFRTSGTFVVALVLNTSRPLFRGNVALRRAINFALDREELVQAYAGGRLSRTPTDQILPRGIPGWVDHRIYPLAGPNLRRARALAAGNLRGGKAILYASPEDPGYPNLPNAIVRNLAKIGLQVEVKTFAIEVMNAKAGVPGEPYDLFLYNPGISPPFTPQYSDAGNQIMRVLAGENARRPSANTNFAYFDKPMYNRRLLQANALTGAARYRAFSRLEAEIMRREAPWAPIYEGSAWLFVAKRVGCVRRERVTDGVFSRIVWWDVCLR